MTMIIQTTACATSVPSTESGYHRFNLHRLTEAPLKLSYQNSNSSQYTSDQETYYQDSTPNLDSGDLNNNFFSDNKFEELKLPSQEESPLDQLQNYVTQSPAQVKNSIFGGEIYTTSEPERQKEMKILNQPTLMSHYTNCEELPLLANDIYDNNQLYLQLDEHSSPMEVPVTSAKRSRRVAVVKLQESGKTVARVRRAPRLRKASTEKVERPKVPKLHQPLSELTRNYHHLPVRDMDGWVNRPEAVRREEVNKRGGYITRPMNSFMLYRSAYAERTKLWCLQNNHQVVSAVSGESWPMEPEYIRCKYNNLARIERMNHQAAHPGYKFSPSKSQSTRKRKGVKDADQSEASDLGDDPEYVENGRDKRKRPPRHAKKQTKGVNFQEGPITVNNKYLDLSGMGEGGASRSSFAATNPGKTPPICMGSTDMTGQYYQTTVQTSRATPVPNGDAVIEDVTIQKTQGPGRSSNLSLGQSWMTSGAYTGDYGWSQEGLEEVMQENSKVDPLLLVQDYGSGQRGIFENQTAQCGVADDIDEGFEMGTFDIDPLFQTDMEGTTYQETQNANGEQNLCENFEGYGTSPIDSAIDIHSLPAYHDSMHGFMDNNDPWIIIKDEGTGAGLKYDEWLQE